MNELTPEMRAEMKEMAAALEGIADLWGSEITRSDGASDAELGLRIQPLVLRAARAFIAYRERNP